MQEMGGNAQRNIENSLKYLKKNQKKLYSQNNDGCYA